MASHSITAMDSPVKPLVWRAVKCISSHQFIQLLVTHHLHGQVRTFVEEAEIQLSVPLPTALAAEGHPSSGWNEVALPKRILWAKVSACDKIRSPKDNWTLCPLLHWSLIVFPPVSWAQIGHKQHLPKCLAFNKGTQCVIIRSHWQNLPLIFCDRKRR